VRGNVKAMLKMQAAAEKAKKVKRVLLKALLQFLFYYIFVYEFLNFTYSRSFYVEFLPRWCF
jgi:hypothetical protein